MKTFSALRSPVNSPHKDQWRGESLMFSLICVWMNDWVNNCEAGDLRRYRAHYDVIVMLVGLNAFPRKYEDIRAKVLIWLRCQFGDNNGDPWLRRATTLRDDLLGGHKKVFTKAQYHHLFKRSLFHIFILTFGNFINVIMTTMASQITSHTIVYSIVYSDVDQRKHQSSASHAFVWGIHRGPVNSPHKWPVTRKMFPFDDVIMYKFVATLFINMMHHNLHHSRLISTKETHYLPLLTQNVISNVIIWAITRCLIY